MTIPDVLDYIVKGAIGVFYAAVLAVGTWTASSLYIITSKLPMLEQNLNFITQNLTTLNSRISDLEAFKTTGQRFTAEDGLTLAQYVQRIQERVIVNEADIRYLKQRAGINN